MDPLCHCKCRHVLIAVDKLKCGSSFSMSGLSLLVTKISLSRTVAFKLLRVNAEGTANHRRFRGAIWRRNCQSSQDGSTHNTIRRAGI